MHHILWILKDTYYGVFPTSKPSIWGPEIMFLKLFAGNCGKKTYELMSYINVWLWPSIILYNIQYTHKLNYYPRWIFLWAWWEFGSAWEPKAYQGFLGDPWSNRRCFHTHQLPRKKLHLQGKFPPKMVYLSLGFFKT